MARFTGIGALFPLLVYLFGTDVVPFWIEQRHHLELGEGQEFVGRCGGIAGEARLSRTVHYITTYFGLYLGIAACILRSVPAIEFWAT